MKNGYPPETSTSWSRAAGVNATPSSAAGSSKARPGVLRRQRADGADAEQALGVRAGLRQHPPDRRQAGAADDDRQALLVDAVGGADERAELLRRHLVQLVDQQRGADPLLLGPLPQGHEQLGQVGLEVTRVGDAGLGLELEPEPAARQPGLDGAGEAGGDAADPLGPLLVAPTAC